MARTRGQGAESSAAGERRRKRRRVGAAEGEAEEEFDAARFRSPRHQTTAYKRSNRVLTMSKVAPVFLALHRLKSLFDFQEITRILDLGEEVYEVPVRDFYTNVIWDEGNQALKGYLRGRDFLVRATDLHEIVSGFHPDTPGLMRPFSNYRQFIQEWRDRAREGPQDEGDVAVPPPPTDAQISQALTGSERFDPANICQTNMLAPIRIRVLEKVVRTILVPKGGDKAALTDLVKIVMVCLLFRRPFDLSRLIMVMMRECALQGRRALGYGKIITALLRKEQFDFTLYHPMTLEAPVDETKVTAMTKGEQTRRARVRAREERAQRDEEEEEMEAEESESEARDSGPDREVRGVTADFQASVLTMLRDMRTEMLAEIRAVGARVAAVEKRVSWLVTAREREARAAGQESELPRRRFALPVEQRESEEETGESSGEEATDGEEETGEDVETEGSQPVEVEEELGVGEEVREEAEAEVEGTEGVREEEQQAGRDVAAEEVGVSGTAEVRHPAEVAADVAEAEEEQQVVYQRRRTRHVIAQAEGSSGEE